MRAEKTSFAHAMKMFSLVFLVAQTTSLVLMMRYTRTRSHDRPLYVSSSAVVVVEMTKLVVCIIVVLVQEGSVSHGLKSIHRNLFGNPLDSLKLAVPAGLYAMQNNLLYLALSHLESSTFQVVYQGKVLTTALFSVFILNRSLTTPKWISLGMLMVGVILVQLQIAEQRDSGKATSHGNSVLGLTAVFISCISSGFAGVYFEKILKGSTATLWMRNIQLASFGFLFSWLVMMYNDGDIITKYGLFRGYDASVGFVILNQALGGLCVAVVVKYGDSIVKGFATAISIVFGCILSMWLFDFQPNVQFVIGTILVILSVFIYGYEFQTKKNNSKTAV